MSRIKVDRITDKAGTGAPILVNGMNVTGKSTMGDIVGAAATFNSITGGSANFSSDVSIGGTLTYEDVKNVDSVGLITARTGIKVTGGGVDVTTGGIDVGAGGIDVNAGGINVTTGDIDVISGSIGIGTVTPANLLDIHGANGAGGLRLTETNHTNLNRHGRIFEYAGGLYFQSRNDTVNGDFIFRGGQDGVEKLRIGSSSQIGIGGANYGTSGQVLTSGGASAAPSWADAGGGAWELLSSVSNPNTSTVDFTGLTTAYAAYKVHFMGASINTNNVREMRCRIYLNGSLKTGSEYQQLTSIMSVGSNSASSGYGGVAGAILLSGAGNGARGYNGELTFPMKLRTTGAVDSLQAFYGKCISHDYSNTIGGFHNNSYSTLLTGIQFDSPDNYNVTDGQFYLYGLKRS